MIKYARPTDWQLATSEAQRAMQESFTCRQEIEDLATAAHGGPIRFAERFRQTAFGSREVDPAWSRDDYVAFLFGEDATFGDAYSSALLYAWQSVAPYVASLH